MIPLSWLLGGVAVVAAFAAGWKVNEWRNDSADLKAEQVAEKAATAATEAAVKAIQGIEVKYVTIKQNAETVLREVPVYRECMHDPRGMQAVNDALAGGQPVGGEARVPGSDTAR